MSDKNQNLGDSLISIWRHKKTGEYIIALRAGVMTKFTNRKFIDKNNQKWIFYSPLATTCQLGSLELNSDYQGFGDEMKKLDTYSTEIKNTICRFIRNDANYDEYDTDRSIDTPFTKLWKVGFINDDNNTQNCVNRNFDFSYVGMQLHDSCGTVANDFWRQFFARACESDDDKYMLFYKHMNIEPFLAHSSWTSLNTPLSVGNTENLRKKIANKGHFIGCDGFIYDFNDIYSQNKIDLYKLYIDFILDPTKYENGENKKNFASKIIKDISDLDADSKKFIETNKVEYNLDHERFEMNVGECRRDATGWIYSKFFPGPEIKCKKYQFVTDLNKEKFEKNNSRRNIYRYEDLVGKNEFNKIKEDIAESWYNRRGKTPGHHEKTNFDFVSNVAKYFNKDFDNINFIDAKTATELESAMNSSGKLQIGDFFSEPEEIERMLKGQPSVRGGESSSDDLFGEYIRHSDNVLFLTSKGERLVNALKQGFANKEHVCQNDEEFEKYFSIAVARALFETIQQENAGYNDFINRLRIYISFMFNKKAYQLAIQQKNYTIYKLNELKKPFYSFQREIKKTNDELTLLRDGYRKKEEEMQTINLTLEKGTNTESKEQLEKKYNKLLEEKKPILPQILKLESQLREKQKEMDSMFLKTTDFDFLQEVKSPIISEDSFNQSNNKLLQVIKRKIDETNIKEFAKLKFGLSENDDKLQQGEAQLKADLHKAIAKDIKYVTDYDGLKYIIEKAIINRFDSELNKAIFGMLSTFKKYKSVEGDYKKNLSVMRVYQFIQHVFNAVGHLAFEKCDSKKDLQMIIFNREEIIFQLSKDPDKIFLSEGKSVLDSLVMNLIQGTLLEKDYLDENMAWIKSMVYGLDQKTTGAEEMSQFSLAAFSKKNRRLGNGFFNNQRKNNAIQTFFIPLQTVEEQILEEEYKIWTNKIEPKLGPKIRMADLNKKCGLTLSDNWELVSVDQMIEDSNKDWIPDQSYEYNEEESIDSDDEPIETHESIDNNIHNSGEANGNNIPEKIEISQTKTEENNDFVSENNDKETLLKTQVISEQEHIDFINEINMEGTIGLKHEDKQDHYKTEHEKDEENEKHDNQNNNAELKQESDFNVNEQKDTIMTTTEISTNEKVPEKKLEKSENSGNSSDIENNGFDNDNNTKDLNMTQAGSQTSTKMIGSEEQDKNLNENKKSDRDNNSNGKQKSSIWSWLSKKISGWWNYFIEAIKSLLCLGSAQKINLSTGKPNDNSNNKLAMDNKNQREQMPCNVTGDINDSMENMEK